MTESQQAAIVQAFLTLETAFDHVLIVVADAEKRGAIVQDDAHVAWAGGRTVMPYLLEAAQARIAYRKISRCPPQVSKDVMNAVQMKMKPEVLDGGCGGGI